VDNARKIGEMPIKIHQPLPMLKLLPQGWANFWAGLCHGDIKNCKRDYYSEVITNKHACQRETLALRALSLFQEMWKFGPKGSNRFCPSSRCASECPPSQVKNLWGACFGTGSSLTYLMTIRMFSGNWGVSLPMTNFKSGTQFRASCLGTCKSAALS